MQKNSIPYKYYLAQEDMPTAWYNVRADIPTLPLHFSKSAV